ncbi:metallophosphoesterase [Nitratireductor sp. StC3]|uniref:metallophosphoesterase n=1 Tax=Nitratireductor sp. StC3 TaxID=2126741 RepID=UPI000D0E20E5|nr:metallophosphoesterase [Nitratireductor sp. StC3]PSM18724.1 serine/threonine protein phosphatase [Nitratireductor sp. StC3]
MTGVHFLDAAAPDGIRLYAIGDVHGRLDLLRAMHGQIRAELMRDKPADWRIVHLGDYVDRGPDSKGVLAFLAERIAEDPHIVALAGNHDTNFRAFLDDGDTSGLFSRYGGIDTARSYGIAADFSNPAAAEKSRAALAVAVPSAHRNFVDGLPRSVAFGDFFFCHAGIRPGVSLADQDPHDLIWIREPFLSHAGLHEKVVVHGHTPQDEAEIMPNRVNVDTLAYASGRLTAFVVDGHEKRLLEARTD